MSEKMELADAGLRHAEGLSAQLDKPDWKPSRAHVEQARNTIKKLAELIRASSPAQEPVTTEPVAWRYQHKEWDALLWRYQTEALVNDDFETPSDWLIEPLYAISAPPQPEEIAEHLYTKFCADPSIEWQDAPEKLKDVWRRYAVEIVALSGENGK